MFLSYDVIATFGVSALVSFFLSVTLLLMVASKRGLLRTTSSEPLMPPMKEKIQIMPSAPELAPLAETR
ncbi:unnamed protein product, partial [Brenthis ino]